MDLDARIKKNSGKFGRRAAIALSVATGLTVLSAPLWAQTVPKPKIELFNEMDLIANSSLTNVVDIEINPNEGIYVDGPVQRIVTAKTTYSKKDNAWIKNPEKELVSSLSFDRKKRLVERIEYSQGGIVKNFSYSYDSRGRLSKLIDKIKNITRDYRYGRQTEFLSEIVCSDGTGYEFVYNEKGKLVWLRSEGRGTLFNLTNIYDSDGKLAERQIRKGDNYFTHPIYTKEGYPTGLTLVARNPIIETNEKYDKKGHLTERIVSALGYESSKSTYTWQSDSEFTWTNYYAKWLFQGKDPYKDHEGYVVDFSTPISVDRYSFKEQSLEVIEEIYNDLNGSLDTTAVATYDLRGNLLKRTLTDTRLGWSQKYQDSVPTISTFSYDYELDEHGNWINQSALYVREERKSETEINKEEIPQDSLLKEITYF